MEMRPGGRKALAPGTNRELLANCSQCVNDGAFASTEVVRNAADGLERVKKSQQVARVGTGGRPCRYLFNCGRHQLDLDMSLTMAQGMKRLGMPIAPFFGVALIGLIATSWVLNRDALRAAVEAQIRAVTGLDLVVNGTIDISVFPGSYVSFHDVGLKGRATADPALSVDVLTANLPLLPLLLQRFETADVTSLRPKIRAVSAPDCQS